MSGRTRLSLRHAFLITLVAVSALLALLFWFLLRGSRQAVLDSANSVRKETAARIAGSVAAVLGDARMAVQDIESEVRGGLLNPDDAHSVESALLSEMLNRPRLSEATFTRAVILGYDETGKVRVGSEPRTQTMVTRRKEGDPPTVASRRVSPGGQDDPALDDTFRGAAHESNRDTAIWSDLHYSEGDERLPPQQRRVVVTVQRALFDMRGAFLGVVRVGLPTAGVDSLLAQASAEEAPHRIFLCDPQGRLISGVETRDRVEESGNDLRFPAASAPAEVIAALQQPAVTQVSKETPVQSAAFEVGGEPYLATFHALPASQDWVVGIVAPERQYVADLLQQRKVLLVLSVVLMGLVLAAGIAGLRAVQGGLDRIVDATARMEQFDFVPAPEVQASFSEVQAVLSRLEQAKTAMRALGKYVPIGLVRLLYQSNREPMLGGELAEVTVLFTDVKDFTTLSEQLDPNELAVVLGRYLDVMTQTIQQTGGIIDKYIGDAVMAAWNVPTPCDHPARRACRAALDCVAATRALFASTEWAGRPALVTRFGLHHDTVMVGHFGAPDRLSYTLLGDGVNLASRLEGLNKQYGTHLIASEAVQALAGEGFRFRLLDRVAVKGKARPVQVYELLEEGASADAVRAYEDALARYWARDFKGAIALLEAQPQDPPSAILAARCRMLIADAPPPDWDGVWVARSK